MAMIDGTARPIAAASLAKENTPTKRATSEEVIPKLNPWPESQPVFSTSIHSASICFNLDSFAKDKGKSSIALFTKANCSSVGSDT